MKLGVEKAKQMKDGRASEPESDRYLLTGLSVIFLFLSSLSTVNNTFVFKVIILSVVRIPKQGEV